jgi:hypothetical protein
MDESTSTHVSTSDSSFNDKSISVIDTDEMDSATDMCYKLASTVAVLMKEIINENKSLKNKMNTHIMTEDFFYAKRIPSMTLEEYLKRIIKYSQMEASTLIMAVIYIDKVCYLKKFILTINNIHRILLAAFTLAIKFNEDDYFKNSHYAKIGGIALEEMNKLEFELYVLLDFSLFVNNTLYSKYEKYLEEFFNKDNDKEKELTHSYSISKSEKIIDNA